MEILEQTRHRSHGAYSWAALINFSAPCAALNRGRPAYSWAALINFSAPCAALNRGRPAYSGAALIRVNTVLIISNQFQEEFIE